MTLYYFLNVLSQPFNPLAHGDAMITLSQLHQSCPCFQIGDVAFFKANPQEQSKRAQRSMERFWASLADEPWLQSLLGDRLEGIPRKPDYRPIVSRICLDALTADYIRARFKLAIPDWLSSLPVEIRHYLDCQWLVREADSWSIIPHTMYAGFGCVILEKGLVEFVTRALGLARLSGIRQLAFLTSPAVSSQPVSEYPMAFDHTRYLHSLEVYTIATLIGYRLGLTREELVLLQVAALSHDILTPAGGDVLKLIDPAAFDEDVHFPEIFERPGWKLVRDRYDLQEEKLAATVLGKGLLGVILDLADKLAYTARDSWEFLRQNHPKGFARKTFAEYQEIRSILRANPYPCAVWEHTERQEDELVFTNEHRLVDFIRLRALMFKILYANASSRFVEAGFVADVAKILYHDGVLTREALLAMDDDELFYKLNVAIGDYGVFCPFHVIVQTNSRVQTFSTFQEALNFERRIAKQEPQTMTRFELAPPPPTKCLSTFKVVHHDRAVPFNQVYPAQSRNIAQISDNPKPYWVYVYDTKIFRNEDMRQRLLVSRNQRIAK